MLTIKVYGPGCANCRKVEEIANAALAKAGVAGTVVKVKDVGEIVDAGVLKTPGLSIDGKLVCSGRIPALESVEGWIREAEASSAYR